MDRELRSVSTEPTVSDANSARPADLQSTECWEPGCQVFQKQLTAPPNKGYHGDVFYLGLPPVRLEIGPMYSSQSHAAARSRAL